MRPSATLPPSPMGPPRRRDRFRRKAGTACARATTAFAPHAPRGRASALATSGSPWLPRDRRSGRSDSPELERRGRICTPARPAHLHRYRAASARRSRGPATGDKRTGGSAGSRDCIRLLTGAQAGESYATSAITRPGAGRRSHSREAIVPLTDGGRSPRRRVDRVDRRTGTIRLPAEPGNPAI